MTDPLMLRFGGVEWRVYERSSGEPVLKTGDAVHSPPSQGESCLVFESEDELRLYCPPPLYWAELSESQLAEYCANARAIKKTHD